ncbi:MAG: phosphotransferase family protein [Acidimicrobiia bacterium]
MNPPDTAALAAAVGRHLGTTVEIRDLVRLSGGASRETWAFDAASSDDTTLALVLRRDPGASVGQSARETEFELLRAAGAGGVAVPTVRFVVEPADGLGSGLVMERIKGETIPRRILRDDAYADARAVLTRQCGEAAARVHALDVGTLPALPVLGAREQIEQYRGVLDSIGEPHPAFELALRWLADHAPPEVEPRLVHGDFRNGNLVVGPDGLRAVLDWELAHLGDPVEDLGWCCVRSWRFGNVDRPVGGFGTVEGLLDAYVAAGGEPVDPDHLRYWETFGTLKWGVICGGQAFTHLSGIVRSVELATLGRRIAETEWDVLGLIAEASVTGPASSLPQPVEPGTGLQDRPTAAELLEAVREFLEADVMTATEGRTAFHARVAVNALGIVERELLLGPAVDAPVLRRIAALVGSDDAPPRTLVAELAARVRDGSLDDHRDEVVAVVVDLVRAKLLVANPRYLEHVEPGGAGAAG